MATVYIQNKDGSPLTPTTRCAHVRILLKEGKAKVVSVRPFVVRLLYEVEPSDKTGILGIDPGRTNIGLTAVDEKGKPTVSIQAETRNKDIPSLMRGRKKYRVMHRRLSRRCVRQRRAVKSGATVKGGSIQRILPHYEKPVECQQIRNKEARFCNRKHKKGELPTPTARHLLETHLRLVEEAAKLVPVTDIVIELNKFAFMALDNPNIRKWEYQKGPLYGYGSVEEAVCKQQEGHCIFCRKEIDHYHHIETQNDDGSDTIANRVGLCEKHHHLVHTDAKWEEKLRKKKAGLNKKYGALSVLNQIIPYLVAELEKRYPGHVYVTDGRSTKRFRDDHGIPKDHYLDAYCIACSILKEPEIVLPEEVLTVRQYRRHDRQVCHQQNIDRKYYIGEECVAMNRHKRTEQKKDSLEEFRKKYGSEAVSKLRVPKHKPTYRDPDRIMQGALMKYVPKLTKKAKKAGRKVHEVVFVMDHSDGKHGGVTDYYVAADGKKYRASHCYVLRKNKGIVFI